MNSKNIFSNRIAKDPNNVNLYLDYAIYLKRNGDAAQSNIMYQKALQIKPIISNLTLPEIESKMRYEIGPLNNNFETYFNLLKQELYRLYGLLNTSSNDLNILEKNVYQLDSITPNISFREVLNEPMIICLGGSAFKILDDLFELFIDDVDLINMRDIAPRTNDFDMMICVSDITEDTKGILTSLVYNFINNSPLASMSGLLPFSDNVVIPGKETMIGLSDNKLFQVSSISKRTYFNVRININVPGKGATHLFEIVLWNNNKKSECKNLIPLKIVDHVDSSKFVIIPTIPDLIENTNRVIYLRGKFNYGKCRQDFLRVKWLYLTMEKLFNSGLVNDSYQSIFGSIAFFNKIKAQINKISDDLKHCNTSYSSIDQTLNQLQSEYNLYIDQILQDNYTNRDIVNKLFTPKNEPFKDEEDEDPYNKKYKTYFDLYQKYKYKYITLREKLKK
jgi:hypothetical protein